MPTATLEDTQAPASDALEVPKLSAVKVYNPIEAGIALMLKKHGDVLVTPPDVSTATALKATKANLTEMVKFRTSIEAARKAEKEESLVYGRLVDSEAKRITAIAAPIEKAYSDAITAEETRLENLRIAELEAERVRITGHKARIQAIKDVRETANLCRTSARLQQLIDGMPAHMEKPFEEFQDEALTAFNEVCTVLGQLLEAKVAQEQQAAELKARTDAIAVREAELLRREREAQEALDAQKPQPIAVTAKPAAAATQAKCDGNHGGKNCGDTECWIDGEPTRTKAPAAAPVEPTLKLGTISERLAPLSITAEGLRVLRFEPAKVVGNSKLYHEADFAAIVNAAITHLGDVLEKNATA